jgi:hypothetical protein
MSKVELVEQKKPNPKKNPKKGTSIGHQKGYLWEHLQIVGQQRLLGQSWYPEAQCIKDITYLEFGAYLLYVKHTAWIFPLYFQLPYVPEETCLKKPVFSKRDLLLSKVPARLHWDLLISGR